LQVQKNGFNIFTANDANGVSMRNSALGVAYATFFSNSEQVLIRGAVDKEKFVVATNGNVPVLNVNTDGQDVSIGEFGCFDSTVKLSVVKSDGSPLFNVDTINKRIKFNGNATKKAEIVFSDVPEALPVGASSSVNMKMIYDEGGTGDGNYVGYIASNGPNAVYNLVSNIGAGMFFVAPVASIESTAVNTFIRSQTPMSVCNIDFEKFVKISGSEGACFINVGDNNNVRTVSPQIQLESPNNCEINLNESNSGFAYFRGTDVEVYAYDTLDLTSVNAMQIKSPSGKIDITTETDKIAIVSQTDLELNAQTGEIQLVGSVNMGIQYPFMDPGTVGLPTLAKQLTTVEYVLDRVGSISSGISDSATAIGNVIGDQLLNPTLFLPSSPTVPPNYLKAGQSYQLTMAGIATFSNGDIFSVSLKSGAVVLGTIPIAVPNVAGGGQTWELEADFTIRSIALNLATIVCSFDFTYNDGQDFIGKRSMTISTTLNTTVSNTLQAFVNFSSGQVTDNITTQFYILRKVIDV
jgi:hypothetical protein